MFYDRGNHHEFTSLVKELAAPGELMKDRTFDFEFQNVEKQHETYTGINVRLRYFVRVTIIRRISDIVQVGDTHNNLGEKQKKKKEEEEERRRKKKAEERERRKRKKKEEVERGRKKKKKKK